MDTKERVIGALIALVAGLVAFAGCFFLLILLGIFTGVIARCATAPEAWIQTWGWLLFFLPLWGGIAALLAGWTAFRWYEERYVQRTPGNILTMLDMASQAKPTRTLDSPPRDCAGPDFHRG